MKTLNVTFEDKDYRTIEKAKANHGGNWHDFFLDLVREYLNKYHEVK